MAAKVKSEKNAEQSPQVSQDAAVSTDNDAKKEEPPKAAYRVKELDPHMYITVRNGYQGQLVYVSKKTQETFIWESFGAEQEMELLELKNAKNSAKAFFVNNWFLIDDPAVIEYIGVSQYYKNALSYESFDNLFTRSPEEITETVSKLSDGQKKSVAYRARQLIRDQKIDSIRKINALEESLSITLIDR